MLSFLSLMHAGKFPSIFLSLSLPPPSLVCLSFPSFLLVSQVFEPQSDLRLTCILSTSSRRSNCEEYLHIYTKYFASEMVMSAELKNKLQKTRNCCQGLGKWSHEQSGVCQRTDSACKSVQDTERAWNENASELVFGLHLTTRSLTFFPSF